MEPIILDSSLNAVAVVDLFDSFIWTERFDSCGEFELYLPTNATSLSYIVPDNFVILKESNRTMIIESLYLNTDIEEGNQYIVKGRTLESILDRRIVRAQTILNGSLQTGITTLLNNGAIAPSDTNRRITKLSMTASTDPLITALTMDDQFHGETLLDAITYICKSAGIGFKITLNSSNNFVFELYSGVDRSYGTLGDSIVLFSPKMDNLLSSQYLFSRLEHKTTTMVGGEGEGFSRKLYDVNHPNGALTELNRRELFTDASNISSTYSGGTLSLGNYNLLLAHRGKQALTVHRDFEAFDGQVDPNINYIYGVDYNLGDIVQLENEYGLTGITMVREYIFSEDKTGTKAYPTFEKV
jgi:hypothetical protein